MNKEILSRYLDPAVQKHMKMLDVNSQEFTNLDINQKFTLMHLTRAGAWVNKAYLRMDNEKAIQFKEYLESEIKNGNEDAPKMLDFYLTMRTPIFNDMNNEEVNLFSQAINTGWLNFYPSDLNFQEFHNILNKMLDDNQVIEVKKIVSNRTMVERDGWGLKAIDYVDYFPELQQCAKELRLAISTSMDAEFNEFLEYQAQALCAVDEELDCKADILWANLKGNVLDFTLTRESYSDTMTESIYNNKDLLNRLKSFDIHPQPKDSLGARVGIRNKEGTQFLLSVQNIADVISANMPQSQKETKTEDNDAVLDLDIVSLCGCECVAGRCTIAQVLPNDDKLAILRGGKHKKVYNRQTRFGPNPEYLPYILAPDFIEYFDISANHYSVICHETTHTFGPQKSLLGKYTSILEEEKADLGALAFLYKMQEAGIFNSETIRKMITTELVGNFQKSKPKLSQAHAVERVMILNKMFITKAIWLDENGLINFNFDKVISSANELLAEVVDIQASGDVDRAEQHIEKYFVWDDNMNLIADAIKNHSPYLIRILDEPLKDYLLSEQAEIDFKNEIIIPISDEVIGGR